MAGAGGDEVGDLVRLVGAVEDEEPAAVGAAPAQRVADGTQPFAVLGAGVQPQRGGEFGDPQPEGGAALGVGPPDDVVLGAEAVDVLGGELGLADAGHAVEGDHAGAGDGVLEDLVGVGEDALASGEAGVAARDAAPDLGGVEGKRGAPSGLGGCTGVSGRPRRARTRRSASSAPMPVRLTAARAEVAVGREPVVTETAAKRPGWAAATSRSAAFHSSWVRGPSWTYQRERTIRTGPGARVRSRSESASGSRTEGSQRCRTTPWPRRSSRPPIQAAQARSNPAKLMVTGCGTPLPADTASGVRN